MAGRTKPGVELSAGRTYAAGHTDADLVARALARDDTAAFGELVRRHQSRVRVFLRNLCREPALADDLAQDTFIHAWNKLASFKGSGSFTGWLLRIAWTTFLQSKRRNDRYHSVLDSVADAGTAQYQQAMDPELADLERLLAVLTEEERMTMILSYACGLSHREISDTLAVPVGTVKSIIHRGKIKIRGHFEIAHHQSG